jgi:sugar lactone lactonase YvrE
MIRKCALDPETGTPIGAWQDFFASTEGLGWADGAVTDSEGFVWSARWGGGKVLRISPDGKLDRVIEVPVSNVSCPAFGGKDMKTLFLTTAREHLTPEQLEEQPTAGSLYAVEVDVPGLPEPMLTL